MEKQSLADMVVAANRRPVPYEGLAALRSILEGEEKQHEPPTTEEILQHQEALNLFLKSALRMHPDTE